MTAALRKLGLGTVQFGLSYGISNDSGKFPSERVGNVLAEAWRAGLKVLDTASAYGDSEAVLGRSLGADQHFCIVTKTLPLPAGEIGKRQLRDVENRLRESLVRLGVQRLYGVLVHHGEALLESGGEALYGLLEQWKRAGRVEKIGVSAYAGPQLRQILERFPLELVQVPVSVFDQRLLRDGTLRALKAAGVEVHVRSVFLQGLLLMGPSAVPASLRRFQPTIAAYHQYLAQMRCTPLAAALGFVKHLPEVDVAVIGIHSEDHLQQCCAAYDHAPRVELDRFASEEEELIDPRLWRLQ
jgi:aryl-alcohol dehydrogenase-like predicted oxidoreductase